MATKLILLRHGESEWNEKNLFTGWVDVRLTQKGEKVKLILPDSSVVYLGAGSKLTWPSHFVKGKLRNIQLEGEAFFEVKHDTSSPFIVHSGQMQTRVLGTSFNVKQKANESKDIY